MKGTQATAIYMMGTCLAPDGEAPPPVPPEPPDPPTPDPPDLSVHWFIPTTGQSLSVGSHALPAQRTTIYSNTKLGYDTAGIPWLPTELVPLSELVRPQAASVYPYNIQGETTSTIRADQITRLYMNRTGGYGYTSHSVNAGHDGWAMIYIEKNGVMAPPPLDPNNPIGTGYSYQAALDEMNLVKPMILAQLNKSTKVRVGFITHQESDYSRTDYGDDLRQLQQDQKTDFFAITGQPITDTYTLVASQGSGYPANESGSLIEAAASAWLTSTLYPTEVVTSCPKYQLNYYSDLIHLTAPSEDRLGIKEGQVYDAITSGQGWTPLQPTGITVLGTAITISLNVPFPPLQWDTTLNPHQAAHTEWANGRGFEVLDSTGPLTIISATITGANQVTLILGSLPSTGLRVRYAMVNDGVGYIRCGQLCDSDPLIGIDAQDYNVSFTNGSTSATVNSPTFKHGPRDIITAASLVGGTIITAATGTNITLSSPWSGTTGAHTANIRYDNRNYLVIFSLPVPYAP